MRTGATRTTEPDAAASVSLGSAAAATRAGAAAKPAARVMSCRHFMLTSFAQHGPLARDWEWVVRDTLGRGTPVLGLRRPLLLAVGRLGDRFQRVAGEAVLAGG